MPGPVPKRSDQRRRRNKPEGAELVQAPAGPAPKMPPPAERWSEIARDWYVSLGESGQSQFYEASDWQYARLVAEAIDRAFGPGRFSAQAFQAVMAAQTDLLVSEGARRRARVELERGKSEVKPASISALADYRKAAGGS